MTGPGDDAPLGRRGFFRDALSGLVRPLAGLAERHGGADEPVRRLRPPGAVPEEDFGAACQRCGKCVEVCPADAIFPMRDADPTLHGAPIINPSAAACVVCTDLACTHACPSGALLPLTRPQEIRMGIALVRSDVCVRSAGEDCSECVDKCPLGPTAISFPDAGPPKVLNGCVGCGVCEFYCPTQPKAIYVEPR